MGRASGMGRIICWVDFVDDVELVLVRLGGALAALAIASKFASLFSHRIRFSVQCLAITERPDRDIMSCSDTSAP